MAEEKKNQVLIVDDDRFLLDMYSTKFSEKGYQVEIAFNAAEALDKVDHGLKPNIFLVDLVMPTMDGFALIKEIKKREAAAKAAVIILSNLGQKEDIEQGMSLGIDGYIIKASATPSEVVERVGEVLKNKKV
jgi:DNA-binding response OmpR family regulator